MDKKKEVEIRTVTSQNDMDRFDRKCEILIKDGFETFSELQVTKIPGVNHFYHRQFIKYSDK